jgi:hypothetical protein
MYVQEITNVKNELEQLRTDGLIKSWELPYENLLTRLSAAIFFIEPADDKPLEKVWETLAAHPHFSYRLNEERKLSTLAYRVTFGQGTH